MTEQQNFADCITQHLPSLNRIVFRLMRGDQMAEDIVQNTIVKALTHANQYRFESTLKTWLTSIAINEVYQLYRSKWRRHVLPLITEGFEAHRCHPLELPTETYEANERDLLVRQAVSRLPPLYRAVVELCDLESLSMSEAAGKLGLTVTAVKSRLHRARKKLGPLVTNLS